MKKLVRKSVTWLLIFGMVFTPVVTNLDLVIANAEEGMTELEIKTQEVVATANDYVEGTAATETAPATPGVVGDAQDVIGAQGSATGVTTNDEAKAVNTAADNLEKEAQKIIDKLQGDFENFASSDSTSMYSTKPGTEGDGQMYSVYTDVNNTKNEIAGDNGLLNVDGTANQNATDKVLLEADEKEAAIVSAIQAANDALKEGGTVDVAITAAQDAINAIGDKKEAADTAKTNVETAVGDAETNASDAIDNIKNELNTVVNAYNNQIVVASNAAAKEANDQIAVAQAALTSAQSYADAVANDPEAFGKWQMEQMAQGAQGAANKANEAVRVAELAVEKAKQQEELASSAKTAAENAITKANTDMTVALTAYQSAIEEIGEALLVTANNARKDVRDAIDAANTAIKRAISLMNGGEGLAEGEKSASDYMEAVITALEEANTAITNANAKIDSLGTDNKDSQTKLGSASKHISSVYSYFYGNNKNIKGFIADLKELEDAYDTAAETAAIAEMNAQTAKTAAELSQMIADEMTELNKLYDDSKFEAWQNELNGLYAGIIALGENYDFEGAISAAQEAKNVADGENTEAINNYNNQVNTYKLEEDYKNNGKEGETYEVYLARRIAELAEFLNNTDNLVSEDDLKTATDLLDLIYTKGTDGNYTDTYTDDYQRLLDRANATPVQGETYYADKNGNRLGENDAKNAIEDKTTGNMYLKGNQKGTAVTIGDKPKQGDPAATLKSTVTKLVDANNGHGNSNKDLQVTETYEWIKSETKRENTKYDGKETKSEYFYWYPDTNKEANKKEILRLRLSEYDLAGYLTIYNTLQATQLSYNGNTVTVTSQDGKKSVTFEYDFKSIGEPYYRSSYNPYYYDGFYIDYKLDLKKVTVTETTKTYTVTKTYKTTEYDKKTTVGNSADINEAKNTINRLIGDNGVNITNAQNTLVKKKTYDENGTLKNKLDGNASKLSELDGIKQDKEDALRTADGNLTKAQEDLKKKGNYDTAKQSVANARERAKVFATAATKAAEALQKDIEAQSNIKKAISELKGLEATLKELSNLVAKYQKKSLHVSNENGEYGEMAELRALEVQINNKLKALEKQEYGDYEGNLTLTYKSFDELAAKLAEAIGLAQANLEQRKIDLEKATENRKQAEKDLETIKGLATKAQEIANSVYRSFVNTPDDTTSGTGGGTTTITTTTAAILPFTLPAAGAALTGVAGVRRAIGGGRRVAAAGEGTGEEIKTDAGQPKLVPIEEEEVKEEEKVAEKTQKTTTIEEDPLPAAAAAPEKAPFPWWLLLIVVAALGAGYAGYKYYDKKKNEDKIA